MTLNDIMTAFDEATKRSKAETADVFAKSGKALLEQAIGYFSGTDNDRFGLDNATAALGNVKENTQSTLIDVLDIHGENMTIGDDGFKTLARTYLGFDYEDQKYKLAGKDYEGANNEVIQMAGNASGHLKHHRDNNAANKILEYYNTDTTIARNELNTQAGTIGLQLNHGMIKDGNDFVSASKAAYDLTKKQIMEGDMAKYFTEAPAPNGN